jgi:Ser/Thr protein kinase RdoA (MazF antagonist)
MIFRKMTNNKDERVCSMNENIKKLFTNSIFQEALYRYGINKETIIDLNGNESFVYTYSSNEGEYVLKIIHSSHRTIEQVIAEVDWVLFLSKQEVPVSLPTPSINGHYVEQINCVDSYFSIVSYNKAKGIIVEGMDYSPKFLQGWGAIMGKMHKSSKTYKTTSLINIRPHWNENKIMKLDEWFPSSLQTVKKRFQELYERLNSLPKGIDDYGLIHSDFHHQNFLVDGSHFTVIDFDDAEYNWYINDIAKTLYNETFNFSIDPQKRIEFARFFLEHFIKGYLKENSIDPFWMNHFQDFLAFRHLFIFIRWAQALDWDTLTHRDRAKLDSFQCDMEENIPLLNLDFEKIILNIL